MSIVKLKQALNVVLKKKETTELLRPPKIVLVRVANLVRA
jgi:hypothetical protein